jgi:simple sugar transport system permease protein
MATFVNSLAVFATPLLLAAIAGLIAERTGVLNVALEGFMLFGAFFAAWGAGSGRSAWAGLALAVAVAVVVGLLFAVVVVSLRADQIAVGIAFNIFALGATSYGASLLNANSLTTPDTGVIAVPGLSDIPWIGPLFDQHWLTWLAYVLVPIASVLLFRTGLGVRARACGEHVEGAQAAGVGVVRWRIGATTLSAVIATLAGVYLVLGDAHRFTEGMTAGKGYIAIAVIILGRWSPLGALAAAAVFGGAEAATFQIQANQVDIPISVVQAIPYVVTIVAVAVLGRRVRPPAEDAKPLPVLRA